MYFQNDASGSLSDHCASPFGQFLNDLVKRKCSQSYNFSSDLTHVMPMD